MALRNLDPVVIENEILYELSLPGDDALVASIARPPISVPDMNAVTFGSVDQIYGMRRWIDKRKEQTLKGRTISVQPYRFENSLIITGEERRGRHFQLIQERINDMSTLARLHWRDLIMEWVIAGTAGTLGLAFDGQFFYDTDHVTEGSGTQSNDLTFEVANADTGIITVDEARQAMIQAAYAILSFKDMTGRIMPRANKTFVHVVPIHLAHSFAAAATMPVILAGSVAVNNTINVGGITHRVEVSEAIPASTDAFFTFVEGGKPLVRVQQLIDGQEVQVSSVTDPNDNWVFENDAMKFGVMAIRGVGYYRWFDTTFTQLTT